MDYLNLVKSCPTCESPRDLDPASQALFDSLLIKSRANDIAESYQERADLKLSIDCIGKDIRRYDAIIARLQEQRALLAGILGLQKHMVSGFQSLPPDVMLQIFGLIIEHDPVVIDGYHDGPCIVKGPIFRLTHVCSVWRKLILSRPSLWSSLDLCLAGYSDFPDMKAILTECLSRMGLTTSINLSLDVWSPRYHTLPGLTLEQLSVLDTLTGVEYTRRFKCLNISCDFHTLDALLKFEDPLLSSPERFPLLEVLHLRRRISVNDLPEAFGRFVHYLPRLHTLKIPSYRVPERLDLPNLAHLDIDVVDGPLTDLLSRCPRLTHLHVNHLQTINNSSSRAPSTIHLRHSYLSTLHVEDLRRCSQNSFHFVYLPNFTHLHVTFSCDDVYSESWTQVTSTKKKLTDLMHILVESKCTLHTVSLDEFNREVTATIFQQLQSQLSPNATLLVDDETYRPEMRTDDNGRQL